MLLVQNTMVRQTTGFLFERFKEEKGYDIKYTYVKNEFQTSMEKDADGSIIKMQVLSVDQEAMKELMINNL